MNELCSDWLTWLLAWCCLPQVAIAQFSDDARTEFQLDSHGNKEELLEAIQRIRYKGGNTKTGLWQCTGSLIHWFTLAHLFPSCFQNIWWGKYLDSKVAVRENLTDSQEDRQ